MEPIYIGDDLRIIDLDKHQYCLQKRGVSKGETVWTAHRYCTTLKALHETARDAFAAASSRAAAKLANERFDASGIPEQIAGLPPKTRKGK